MPKISDLLQDPDFQALQPQEQASIRRDFAEKYIMADPEFQALDDNEKASIISDAVGLDATPIDSGEKQSSMIGAILSQANIDSLKQQMADTISSIPGASLLGSEQGRDIAAGGLGIAAKVLEPLRTPTVGLGGMTATAHEYIKSNDLGKALDEGAKSVSERRGLGEELLLGKVSKESLDTIPGRIAVLAAEIATDPLTFTGGAIVKAGQDAFRAVRSGKVVKEVAPLIGAGKAKLALRKAGDELAQAAAALSKSDPAKAIPDIRKGIDDVSAAIANEAKSEASKFSDAIALKKSRLKELNGEVTELSKVRATLGEKEFAKQKAKLAQERYRLNNEITNIQAIREEILEDPTSLATPAAEGLRAQFDTLKGMLFQIESSGAPDEVVKSLQAARDKYARALKDYAVATDIWSVSISERRVPGTMRDALDAAKKSLSESAPMFTPKDVAEVQAQKANFLDIPAAPFATPEAEKAAVAAKESASFAAAKAADIFNTQIRTPNADWSDTIKRMAEMPEFKAAFSRQKGGVISADEQIAAAQELGLGLDVFAGLKPRQIPRAGGHLNEYTAAAKIAADQAMSNINDIAIRVAKEGASPESVADEFAANFQALVGAEGVKSETGRALGILSKKSAFERAQANMVKFAVKERLLEDPAAAKEFFEQMSMVSGDLIAQRLLARKVLRESTFSDMILEARAAALLTSPKTFVRNFIGNQIALTSKALEEAVEGWLSGGSPMEAAHDVAGMISGWKQSAADALEVLVNESSTKGFGSEFSLGSGAIPGKLGRVVRIPFRALNAADTFQKGLLFNGEIRRLAFRKAGIEEGLSGAARNARIAELVANPSESMIKQAMDAAAEFTFQETLPKELAKIQSAIRGKGVIGRVLSWVVPFFKTPANIVRFTARRTPIVSDLTDNALITPLIKQVMGSGPGRQAISKAAARNIVGTAAISSMYIAANHMEGRITGGGPRDSKKKRIMMEQGWRPYSIKLGNDWFSYRGFEPISTYLSSIADLMDKEAESPSDDFVEKSYRVLTGVMNNFAQQPFLTGIKEVMEAMEDDGSRMVNFIERQAASVVPMGLTDIRNKMDLKIRQPEGIVERIMERAPYFSESVPERRTRFGEPISMRRSVLGFLADSKVNNPIIENELMRLNQRFLIGFQNDRVRVGNQTRKYTREEYQKMVGLQGQILTRMLPNIIQSEGYQSAPDVFKTQIIRQATEKVREATSKPFAAIAEMRSLGIEHDLRPDEMVLIDEMISHDIYGSIADDATKKKTMLRVVGQIRSSR